MVNESVSNDVVLAFLKSFKGEFDVFKQDVYRRFDSIDREFEKVNKEFEKVNKEFEKVNKEFETVYSEIEKVRDEVRDVRLEVKEVREAVKGMEGRLNEIYYDRERVRVHFGLKWAVASFCMSVISVVMVLALQAVFA